MRKIILLILLSVSLHSTAQFLVLGKKNRLDQMVRNSIESYIKHVDDCWLERGWKKPSVYYVNPIGLTKSYTHNKSIFSIPRVEYISFDNAENDRQWKKVIKKGIQMLFVETQLNKKTITIAVTHYYVCLKNDFPVLSINNWGIYSYIYSENKEDWVLEKIQIGGI